MTTDELIKLAIQEDIGDGDHTSMATIPSDAKGRARLIIKEPGILAGMTIAEKVFTYIDKELQFTSIKEDGTAVNSGDIAFELYGKSISILSGERLALNFLQRMSGIATFTQQIVKLINGTKVKILDTRKTTPNMRIFEKEAVRIGGGYNHRMGLYDMIMIKDNHIDFAGGIKPAIDKTRQYLEQQNKNLKIEIEVRNFKELEEVMACGKVDRIMLDNFSPDQIKEAVALINGRYETEASGSINLQSVRSYAETGIDYISVGALTHQIKSLDMSLKAI